MLKPDMQQALNKQINEEFYSSYVYASMANYFEHVNLHGSSRTRSRCTRRRSSPM